VQETVMQLVDENRSLRDELASLRLRLHEVERLADMDTLTPLPNRRCFVREVERVVSQVARYGENATVVFVDVDGLKSINDCYGHSAGDAALIHVATILRKEIRSGDLVARIGGDEFGLLLDHLDEPLATAKALSLMHALQASPLELGGASLTIGLSMGVAMITADDTVDTLLARADGRMYAARAAQRTVMQQLAVGQN
jgi:diguanylate cyclase (GGDEF)-like protein